MFKALLISLLTFGTSTVASAADKVTLQYGWKPGIYVKVIGFQTQQKTVGDRAQAGMKIDLSYIMSTRAHKAGLQVDYMDVKASVLSDDPSLQSWMKNYIEEISAAMPSLLISPEGQMRGALELAKLRETMIKSLSDVLHDAPAEQKQQLLSNLNQLFSDEFLNRQFADDWNLNVGQWPGVELEDDGFYEVEFDTPIPALGNRLVKTVAQVTFSGRVNCDSTDQSRACVKLIYHSETDDVAMKELLGTLLPSGQPVPDLKINVVLDAELVTAPDTLLPYSMKQTKSTSSPVETPQGLVTVTSVQVSEFKYLYVMGNAES
jgi:hypothetical protein